MFALVETAWGWHPLLVLLPVAYALGGAMVGAEHLIAVLQRKGLTDGAWHALIVALRLSSLAIGLGSVAAVLMWGPHSCTSGPGRSCQGADYDRQGAHCGE